MKKIKLGCLITSSLVFVGLSLVIRHLYLQLDRIQHESEAKSYAGALNRANQAYFSENQKFSTQPFPDQIQFPSESKYKYEIEVINDPPQAITTAIPKVSHLRSHTGIVFAWPDQTENRLKTRAVVCINLKPGKTSPKLPLRPAHPKDIIRCPDGLTIPEPD